MRKLCIISLVFVVIVLLPGVEPKSGNKKSNRRCRIRNGQTWRQKDQHEKQVWRVRCREGFRLAGDVATFRCDPATGVKSPAKEGQAGLPKCVAIGEDGGRLMKGSSKWRQEARKRLKRRHKKHSKDVQSDDSSVLAAPAEIPAGWKPYESDVVGHDADEDVIVVLGQDDEDNILRTGVYETEGGEGVGAIGMVAGGGDAATGGIEYDDDYATYEYGDGGGGEEEDEGDGGVQEEGKGGGDYGMYYDYDYGGGEGEGGEEDQQESDDYDEEVKEITEEDGQDNEDYDEEDNEDYGEEEVGETYVKGDESNAEDEERDYGGEEYDEDDYEEGEEEEYDDDDEVEDGGEDYDAEELLYRNYELLSEFYKRHFVDLRVLDESCDPETVPPPEVEHGAVDRYRTVDNVLLPGKRYHEVIYKCRRGFRLAEGSGSGSMFCQQGGWMGVHPYCEEDPYAEETDDGGDVDQEGCGDHHECDHLCRVSEDGAHQCYCEDGYRLESETTCVDIDECDEDGEDMCEHECINKPGTYECTCPTGYRTDGEAGSCVDVNECVANNGHGPCQDVCTNTVGSYQCSCENLPGTVVSGHDCEAQDMCSQDNGGCSHECYTTYGKSFCMCPSGFKLGEDWKTCEDVDECETMASVRDEECGGAQFCVNTEGSYKCVTRTEVEEADEEEEEKAEDALHPVNPTIPNHSDEHVCDAGYTFDFDSSVCVDVDECVEEEIDCGSGVCVNLEPGFECRCQVGFYFDGATCQDVNECEEDPCGIHGTCRNLPGSHECTCHQGFRPTNDSSVCADVDECEDRCLEHGRCFNEEGGFACECERGFRLDDAGENCVDVDECAEIVGRGGRRPCGRARCVNEPGSFSCRCRRPGFVFDEAAGRCKREDPCAKRPCGGAGRCSADRAAEAGFVCRCPDGYRWDDARRDCLDVDECAESRYTCQHLCENTEGAFRCFCRPGFEQDRMNSSACLDIDECSMGTHSCQQSCVNTEGSYKCKCIKGYETSKDDPAACVPIELEEERCRLPCSHGCGERATCKCPAGMVLGPDRYTCKAIPVERHSPGCPPLPASDGLKIRCSQPVGENYAYAEGVVCRGRCSVGFVPHEGRLRKKCRGDGSWSGTGGTCKRVYCPPIDDLAERGVLVTPSACAVDHSLVRQRCKFSCPDGFRLVGSRSARCRRNSEWRHNGGPPKCVRVEAAVTYGTTTSTTTTTLPPRSYDYTTTTASTTRWVTTTTAAKRLYPTTTPFSYTSPYIYCPPDVTKDLPAHSNTVHVRIPQPKTNVNWYDFVRSTPAWAKKLEGELGLGKTLVTFQALSPISEESSSCSFSIHVRDTVAPRVYNCPKDFRAFLDEGQERRQVFWEEPIFSDNVKITHVMASKMPGQMFGEGAHRVLYQASDEDGNEAKCTFTITVLNANQLDMRKRRWVACRVGSTGRLIRLFVAHVPRGCWKISPNDV